MKDPYTQMSTEFMWYSVFLTIVMNILAGVSGCTTQIAPNLKLPEAKACPTLKLPPIPDDVLLDIKGDKITANAGGEWVLRGYAACRSQAAVANLSPR